MKILIYNWKDIKNPEVGGAEMIAFEFAKRLVRDGHQVTVFSRSFIGCKTEEEITGVKVVRQGKKFSTYIRGWLYYRSLKVKPDLVIDMLNTIFWQTPLYAKKSQIVAYVNQLAREVLFYELGPIVAKIAYHLENLQFKTYRKTNFLCYANSTKEDLVKVGIPAEQVKIFSLGLDHERYFPGEKYATPLFLCVSRLVRMKRTDLAVRAMAEVILKYPLAKLAIVGYGYDRHKLEDLRNQLKLQNNVFFADENILFFEKSDKDQKIKLMQQSWALIFPSVKEGWGMTVTECAACGTPAIVTNVTGLCDSVKPNETGLVISANPTVEELSEVMLKIIEFQDLRKRLSAGALAYAANFSWDKSYQEFKDKLFSFQA